MMNYEDYKAKRDELMGQAKAALDAGKVDDAKAARKSIEELDAAYEDAKAEAANLAALETGLAKPAAPVAPQAIQAAATGPAAVVAPAVDTAKAREDMYRTAFAKTLMERPLSAEESEVFAKVNQDAFATVANKASGNQVVIPTTMKQQIWEEMAEVHPIINEVDFTDVPGKVEIPKETGNSGDASWVDEDTAATSGTLSLSNVTLDGHELVKAITVSWKLKTMSIDAFLTYITSKIAERMGAAIANAIVNGKGVPGQSDTFKASAYELFNHGRYITVIILFFAYTRDRSCFTENESEVKAHQIIHYLVELLFTVVSAVDGFGLLNGLHVEQNFQLLVEQTCLAVQGLIPYLAVTLLAVAENFQNPCIESLLYLFEHDILDV